LKDLEASPEITQVSSVRLTKLPQSGVALADSSLMQITLVPEVWVLPRNGEPAAAEPAAPPPSLEGAVQ
ncbi:MAG: hypothetical protein Q8L55_03665, partial [Phycisphaerales bacterium]|nr:hypothetical protein [Phycisphaerales bacterium]